MAFGYEKEVEQKLALAEVEIARLRLTDEEREAIEWAAGWATHFADGEAKNPSLTKDVRDRHAKHLRRHAAFCRLLERLK